MDDSGTRSFEHALDEKKKVVDHVDGLALKSLEEVKEPGIDPRVDLECPVQTHLAKKKATIKAQEALEDDRTLYEDEPLYVEFERNDPRDPANFSHGRKWAITAHASFATLLAASTGTAYSLGYGSMCPDLGCTDFRATIGLSMYNLGFGIVPLFTSSLSEEVGRQPLYYVSAVGFLSMFVLIAEAPNMGAVFAGRLLQGAFGSTWSTMVGGTIADIWAPHERGVPMSLFAVAGIGGSGLGAFIAGWVESNADLQWKWIQWIFMILTGAYITLLPLIMRETRATILLRRLAQKVRKETGNSRYRARIEDERVKLGRLIWVSASRPLYLLATEPVVFSFSLWIAFAWGVMFALIESVPTVFRELYGMSTGQVGTIFVTMMVGSALGWLTNLYQERLYQNYFATRSAEARLYLPCVAAVTLPSGCFIYAWTSYSDVHWIAPAIGITVLMWSVFVIYLAVFTYLADAYGPFASSALAGQSLCRNLAAMAFPLFTTAMYKTLGYHWAGTLFACIASIMVPIPYALFFFGPTIRARSKFSRLVLEQQQRQAAAREAEAATPADV